MRRYAIAITIAAATVAGLLVSTLVGGSTESALECVEASSSGSFACKDAGNFDSTCATATCPADYTLTGGGGACAAGDRKVKTLSPRLAKGEFTIACEQQGVDPQARAICCRR
jgi:hypothetical protein